MEDHVVVDVERLVSAAGAAVASSDDDQERSPLLSSVRALQQTRQSSEHVVVVPLAGEECVAESRDFAKGKSLDGDLAAFGGATGVTVECRICQEEDDVGNLEAPCACSGSVKYAHRKCVQRWCNEKGDTTCEICQKPYQPGYTAPPRPAEPEGIPIDLSGNWGITGPHQLDLRDPRILAMAAERHFLDSDYDEYASANASSAACCRSAALILMALLLLRHALAMAASGADDDTSALFTEATMAEVAILIQAGQAARAIQFSPAAAATPPPPAPGPTIPIPAATT